MIEAVWERRLSRDGNGGFLLVVTGSWKTGGVPAHHWIIKCDVFSRAPLKYVPEHANTVTPAQISVLSSNSRGMLRFHIRHIKQNDTPLQMFPGAQSTSALLSEITF